MAARRHLGCLAALVFCALTACKDKGNSDLEKRCAQVAKACGDKDKHVEKVTAECKQAAAKYVDKGCADKATALFDCYEKNLCGGDDRVWALDDLRVLSERHKKCVAERTAASQCIEK